MARSPHLRATRNQMDTTARSRHRWCACEMVDSQSKPTPHRAAADRPGVSVGSDQRACQRGLRPYSARWSTGRDRRHAVPTMHVVAATHRTRVLDVGQSRPRERGTSRQDAARPIPDTKPACRSTKHTEHSGPQRCSRLRITPPGQPQHPRLLAWTSAEPGGRGTRPYSDHTHSHRNPCITAPRCGVSRILRFRSAAPGQARLQVQALVPCRRHPCRTRPLPTRRLPAGQRLSTKPGRNDTDRQTSAHA